MEIKKPWLDKIEPSGAAKLEFTELRMKEVDELRDPDQDESNVDKETNKTFAYDTEGEVSRIYGTFVGNSTRGI